MTGGHDCRDRGMVDIVCRDRDVRMASTSNNLPWEMHAVVAACMKQVLKTSYGPLSR